MLRLILGRARTGKTTYVRRILAENAEKGNNILIVPEQFSFESEKAIIEMLGAGKASDISVLSFTSLSKRILDEYVPCRKPAVTDAAKTVIMSLTLEALSEKLKIFGRCARNRHSVAEILHITDELIQCDVSYDAMNTAARESGNRILMGKAQEIELISSLYSAMLTEKFSDDRYMINSAAEIIAEKNLFEGKTVVIDEFSGFTAQQNLILAHILRQAKDVYVTMCADSVRDYSEGTGAFSYSVENINRLISLARKNDVPVAEPVILSGNHFENSAALACIEKGLYEPCPEVFTDAAPEITIATARNLYEECEFVAMSAKKLVRENSLRYRDIVIVSRSEEYNRYLPFALKKYDIPVFEDTRRKLSEELIVVYAMCALTLAAESFTTDCLLRMLKTYISPIADDDISILENYVMMWQIDYSGWLRDWTGHPDGLGVEFTDEAREKLEYINQLRRQAVIPVCRLREKLADTDGFGATQAVYEFLIETGADKNLLAFAKSLDGDTAYECERSWDEFMNVLSLLAETVGTRSISPSRYLELFRIMADSSDIGDIPGGIDEITVGDAERIRVSGKKVLFVVGANDGVFPAVNGESFVFTDNERKLFKNQGVELGTGSIDAMRKERLRVYSTLSIPSERLYISYSAGSITGEEKSASEIVYMVHNIVPSHTRTDISQLSPLDKIESEKSAFESASLHFYDNTEYSESLKAYIEHSEYADMLRGIARNAEKSDIGFENNEIAEKLFGKNMYISPSRVEEYYKCPFRYFCRYGLKASSLEKVSFDPRQNGLLIHYVLEKLVREYGGESLFTMPVHERRTAVSKTTDDYIEKYIGTKDSIDKRLLYSLERSKDTVCEIIERLAPDFNECRFVIRDVELVIGNEAEVKPYDIELPDGGKVTLHGVVDRVDTMTDEKGTTYLRVLDYKSGGKDFKLSDVVSGLNIQMLVYLMCLCENGKDRYGDFIPAGILYISAKGGKNSLGRYADEDEIHSARVAQSKMKGIVLGDEDVIFSMEGKGTGTMIDAGIDAKKGITGSVYMLENFKTLHKAVDRIVRDMAVSLHNGRVEALPIYGTNYKNTCTYCDFRFVCCHEEDDACRAIFDGEPWEALEAMNNG